MTDKYDIHVIVPAKLVGPLVELLDGEGTMVSMTPVRATTPVKRRTKHARVSKLGIKSTDAVLTILREDGRPMTQEAIGKQMNSRWGFAASGASSVLSRLAAEKKVAINTAVVPRTYALALT